MTRLVIQDSPAGLDALWTVEGTDANGRAVVQSFSSLRRLLELVEQALSPAPSPPTTDPPADPPLAP